MGKKENMKQAMYEMFGVGTDLSEELQSAAEKEPEVQSVKPVEPLVPPVEKEEEKTPAIRYEVKPKVPASYIAPGTVLEGTLRSTGDVEIAGDFKGDITTEGVVILHSSTKGNITAKSLNLSSCTLEGDVIISEVLTVSQTSSVRGNVVAREVVCAGQITGDLKVSENTALESSARVNGGIVTGSISVIKGAEIHGSVEIKPAGSKN